MTNSDEGIYSTSIWSLIHFTQPLTRSSQSVESGVRFFSS